MIPYAYAVDDDNDADSPQMEIARSNYATAANLKGRMATKHAKSRDRRK
jgi:hypothetical protein